jgi:hypothetical protein
MTIRRTQALFDAMAGDHLFREQFVTDPAQIYTEYVHSSPLDRHRADVINQFVYAVLANDDLLGWVMRYRNQYADAPPPDSELAQQFTKAVVDNNAHHAALAMTRAATERQPIFPLDPAIKDLIFGGQGPGAAGLTGLQPVTGITQSQTFQVTDSVTGTEVSTDFQTFQVTGGVFTTEVSTGTQTEISTGTEITEMSTPPPPDPPFPPIVNVGPIVNVTQLGTGHTHYGVFDNGAFQVVIDTMRAFAAELRDRGALDDVGQS